MNRLAGILCLVTIFVLGFQSLLTAHQDVTPEEAKDMIDTMPDLIVVDIREYTEYCSAEGHVPGAINYPWISNYLQENYTDFMQNDEILVICRSGNRSNQAAEFLDSVGFTNIYDMAGGMYQWLWETETCEAQWGANPGTIIGNKDQPGSEPVNYLLLLTPFLVLVILKNLK